MYPWSLPALRVTRMQLRHHGAPPGLVGDQEHRCFLVVGCRQNGRDKGNGAGAAHSPIRLVQNQRGRSGGQTGCHQDGFDVQKGVPVVFPVADERGGICQVTVPGLQHNAAACHDSICGCVFSVCRSWHPKVQETIAAWSGSIHPETGDRAVFPELGRQSHRPLKEMALAMVRARRLFPWPLSPTIRHGEDRARELFSMDAWAVSAARGGVKQTKGFGFPTDSM